MASVQLTPVPRYSDGSSDSSDDDDDSSDAGARALGGGGGGGGSESAPRLRRQHASVLRNGWCAYLRHSLRVLAVGTPGDRPWLNFLLLLMPLAFLSDGFGWGNGLTFALALLAMCPFAERLNFVTEDLTKYTNATVGGLLNASFGNVTEMVVSIMALRQGELWIIEASMLGSILSNLLLVLGSAFFVGGCRRHRGTGPEGILQSFNPHAANVNISLLLLCVAAFSLPGILVSDIANIAPGGAADAAADADTTASAAAAAGGGDDIDSNSGNATATTGEAYSACAATVLLLVYAFYLAFQLKTHSGMFDDDLEENARARSGRSSTGGTSGAGGGGGGVVGGRDVESGANPLVNGGGGGDDDDDDDDDDEPPVLGLWGALVWLGVATIFISLLSDMLVDSFTTATDGIGVPDAFAWTILVPIVGNAAEHASAVIFAYKDRMSVAVSVAVGSAAQIGVFVVPLLVVISYFITSTDGSPPLSFAFSKFAAGSLLLAVLLAGYLLQARRSHWLGGTFLIGLYILIAAGLWQTDEPL